MTHSFPNSNDFKTFLPYISIYKNHPKKVQLLNPKKYSGNFMILKDWKPKIIFPPYALIFAPIPFAYTVFLTKYHYYT